MSTEAFERDFDLAVCEFDVDESPFAAWEVDLEADDDG